MAAAERARPGSDATLSSDAAVYERERDKQLCSALRGAFKQVDLALAAADSIDHRWNGTSCTAVVLAREGPSSDLTAPAKLLVASAGDVRVVVARW